MDQLLTYKKHIQVPSTNNNQRDITYNRKLYKKSTEAKGHHN